MKALTFVTMLCLICSGCFYREDGRPCFGKDGSCDEGYFCDVQLVYSGSCEPQAELGQSCVMTGVKGQSCKGAGICRADGEATACFIVGANVGDSCDAETFSVCDYVLRCDEQTKACVEAE